jgi:glycine/D-amino acid oxidase-like deaminating enzyme
MHLHCSRNDHSLLNQRVNMYDPWLSNTITANQSWPHSYWADEYRQQSGMPSTRAKLTGDHHTEVAVIGAGYTGLNCALSLAESGIEATILEANQPGWGCAGRNAGFILPGSGRLGYSAIRKKYGEQAAGLCYRDYFDALDSIAERLEAMPEPVQLVNSGYLKIAHNKSAAKAMQQEWLQLPAEYKQQSEWISDTQISQQFIPGYQGAGALFRESGQALNPFRYAQGLSRMVSDSGVKLYADSPVTTWHKDGNKHVLSSTNGKVTADKVVIASNAYSATGLHRHMRKQFPVLSSILVTTPLPSESADSWYAHLTAMDTRSLKYYYRLLPDNRILFGGRGAISGKQADSETSQKALKAAFNSYFPALADLQTSHFWNGWVSVAYDDLPHIGKTPEDSSVYFATGFCGSGVSFATHAGKRIAQLIQGKTSSVFDSPVYQQPLPDFPFARFRRTGLRGFYIWQKCLDSLGLN